jgi:hypothetical protein
MAGDVDAGVPRWMPGVVATAWALTLLGALVGGELLWWSGPFYEHTDAWAFRHLTLTVVGVGLALVVVTPSRTSLWMRAAIALPFVHAAAIVVAWRLWCAVDGESDTATFGVAAAALVLAYAVVARIVAGRRERLHAVTMLALSTLLLVGPWALIATALWPHPTHHLIRRWNVEDVQHLLPFALVVVVPPLIAAVAFTVRRFQRRPIPQLNAVLAGVFTAALIAALDRQSMDDYVIGKLVPVLVAVALVAIAALAMLAIVVVVDGARGRRRLTGRRDRVVGVVRSDEPVVAAVAIPSWLRGPQQVVERFSIVTDDGEVPVPAGARWAGPVPAQTTQLRRDEAAVVLRAGDHVVATGFARTEHADPFRTASAWLQVGEVWISRTSEIGAPRNAAYALWRPAVAFLVIAVAVGVPALVAAVHAL